MNKHGPAGPRIPPGLDHLFLVHFVFLEANYDEKSPSEQMLSPLISLVDVHFLQQEVIGSSLPGRL